MKAPEMPKIRRVDLRGVIQDFQSLDPKEIGNWPAAPKAVALFVLFVAILAAGWWFDWSDQLNDLDAKRRTEEQLKKEYLDKKRQAINLEEYKKQLAEIDRAFGALLKQLPNKSEMEALVVDVNQAGLGRGLQFDLFKPGGEVMKDFYAELPITISVSGSYHDLGHFAGDIAKLSRIVTLRDLQIQKAKDQPLLKMDAVAVTYRYLDEEEVAKQKKEKAEAAKKGARK
jgi:type IV pilus assembly protein PilO